ncbi:MAG: PspC domain-containing protein [Ignavibacteriales bacterium]|nr:PspC domain-containing protein [Ignavibacteriales bacterium]
MEEQNLHNELFGGEQPQADPVYQVRKLQRSGDNVVIAGVCAGIAEYSRKNTATIRVIAMLLLLLGAWIVAAYLIIAFLLPIGKHDEALTEEETKATGKENFKTVVSGLFVIVGLHFALVKFGFSGSSSIFILPNTFMFPLLAIAGGVFLLTNKLAKSKINPAEITEFYRSRSDKFLLGVCGGIAKYLGIDSSSLRIIFLLLTGLTLGMFAVAYLVIAFTSQQEPQPLPLQNE